ncbi:MAG: AtpZ/AtpI family protein [Planctomycetota bacterium]
MADSGHDPQTTDSSDTPEPKKASWSDRFFGLAPAREPSPEDDARREKHAMAGAGLELAAGIGLFAGIGYGIDRWFGTLPWGTVIGALLGMTAGLYLLIKAAHNIGKRK